MRWLIDFDSTLSNTHSEAIQAVNKRFGSTYTDDDITSWATEEILTEDEIAYLWGPELFLNEDFQINVKPVEGSIEGVRKLIGAGHDLTVVTDRHPIIHDVTRAWLDKQGLSDVPVSFTRSRESNTHHHPHRTKAQVAWSKRLTHVVEDAPHHSLGLAQRAYIEKVYLIDKPYNQDIQHPKVQRIKSWEEVRD